MNRWKKRQLQKLARRMQLQEQLAERPKGTKLDGAKKAARKQQAASRKGNR